MSRRHLRPRPRRRSSCNPLVLISVKSQSLLCANRKVLLPSQMSLAEFVTVVSCFLSLSLPSCLLSYPPAAPVHLILLCLPLPYVHVGAGLTISVPSLTTLLPCPLDFEPQRLMKTISAIFWYSVLLSPRT